MEKSSNKDNTNANNNHQQQPATRCLKKTPSQIIINSSLFKSFPSYVFKSDHHGLDKLDGIMREVKEQERNEELSNQTDCEVSEYPIEYYENQEHAIERHMKKKVHFDQTGVSSNNQINADNLYNKIITNEETEGPEIEDLEHCAQLLVKSMIIREKYMMLSQQLFPPTVARSLNKIFVNGDSEVDFDYKDEIQINEETKFELTETDPFDIEMLPSLNCKLALKDGIVRIYDQNDQPFKTFVYTDLKMFVDDYHLIVNLISNGPLRLHYLKSKFELHCMLNEFKEITQQKSVPHRDFYNVRKVDTHIHAASCMNQKHLLRFIKKKMKTNGDKVVLNHQKKGPMTLDQVFKELNLTPFDLSVNKLAVHADRSTFQRFDIFNSKYNPIGQSSLRDIFIKVDNDTKGEFFAEILKEVTSDLEDSTYQNVEMRLTIYGCKYDEWDKLAEWAVKNKMYSPNNKWMVQVPRIYDIFNANSMIQNFGQILYNIFMPLFEVTNDPSSHPYLHKFLYHVSGFDSVDDESKPERDLFNMKTPFPEKWTSEENPPYVYYLYYMYANLQSLNNFRRERGLNLFNFRPHCGEAGSINHLVASFMLADNISHGLELRKAPVLQYLYYLCQIGIAMSPLGSNSLFLDYIKNPFYDYHSIGMNVSLSTDAPLQFHFTKEPLMEEYSIASQVWKLSSVDVCELARNSVLMSGFSHSVKLNWLGENYLKEGVQSNDVNKTNVPDIRIAYRFDNLCYELNLIVNSIIKNRSK